MTETRTAATRFQTNDRVAVTFTQNGKTRYFLGTVTYSYQSGNIVGGFTLPMLSVRCDDGVTRSVIEGNASATYICTGCGSELNVLDQPAHNDAEHAINADAAQRVAPNKNADLTDDQIEFAIEYLSAHAKQAETDGFFRVCGRALTAIAELRTEQADRALAWAEAQSNR